jgi:hypothetical protein
MGQPSDLNGKTPPDSEPEATSAEHLEKSSAAEPAELPAQAAQERQEAQGAATKKHYTMRADTGKYIRPRVG